MSKKRYCKKCEAKPGKLIAVDDVFNPRCSSCGREFLEMSKKIEKIGELQIKTLREEGAGSITGFENEEQMAEVLHKINEVIEAFNKQK